MVGTREQATKHLEMGSHGDVFVHWSATTGGTEIFMRRQFGFAITGRRRVQTLMRQPKPGEAAKPHVQVWVTRLSRREITGERIRVRIEIHVLRQDIAGFTLSARGGH
ncbi:hypothetical protein PCA_15200 [Rhodanobacter sp. PCA2]|nr:hypothetical protein [Rhodanobacter sp. PCA2]